ncbi:MAG: hypothetical protein LBT00_12545 [Spirochaetaceae bacterium]|nr:hypothetical protein [Spirochaetaceae bacterium]
MTHLFVSLRPETRCRLWFMVRVSLRAAKQSSIPTRFKLWAKIVSKRCLSALA